MNGDAMRRVRLTAAITEAVGESKLPWPDYGIVIAAALTNIVGNPITVSVYDGQTVLEFDRDGRYRGRVVSEGDEGT